MESIFPVSLEWTQSHKADPEKIGFLDLPSELREHIFNFALIVPGAILVQSPYIYSTRLDLEGRHIRYKGHGPVEPRRISQVISISMLRLCRQLHAESSVVLFGRNIFSFSMGNSDFAACYRELIHHIVFTMEAGRGIYNDDMEVMGYWWRRVFWPNIVGRSSKLLQRYPNLEILTLPIKPDRPWGSWRPAFMAVEQKTREQRIALGARWLAANCRVRDERLREVLQIEVQGPSVNPPYKTEFEGSRFVFEEDNENEEWDHNEFAVAFSQAKVLQSK
ncbi:hypothetical protein P280DRAFT_10298 [Massarina eburnea CBS 473.64]|uniref:Uncharacterized protein n=1 Tax=Massarina eburnea CBS 473.64 TaxID=1395130 RepID=A0A6A6SIA6_9PLEO|nr:hypothetical protein P280DRAFT_10298 [Massarina eburnea CBS 473.64]